jgi:hypothetical protein
MNFKIEKVSRENIDDFNLEEILYNVTFNDNDLTFNQASDEIFDMFNSLREEILSISRPNDMVNLNIFHNNFAMPINIPFTKARDFNLDLIMGSFENVIQSYKEVVVNYNNSFTAKVMIQQIPSGSGRKKLSNAKKKSYYKKKVKIVTTQNPNNGIVKEARLEKAKTRRKLLFKKQRIYFKKIYYDASSKVQTILNKKHSISKIPNDDNFCALRAILLAKSQFDLENGLIDKHLTKCELENELNKIRVSLNFKNEPFGIEEIKRIEFYLKFYSISVLNGKKGNFAKFLYRGINNKYYLYICLTESHYNVIPNMATFFDRSHFCNVCKKPYSDSIKHRCSATCKTCFRQDCNNLINEADLVCSKCSKKAKNKFCLERHAFLYCQKRRLCEKCNNVRDKNHICTDEKFCSNCKIKVNLDHKCYLKRDHKFDQDNDKFNGYIFYDYECTQLNGIHVPNLVIARKVCVSCIERETYCETDCQLKIFYDNDSFCEWLFQQENTIAIAHNFKVKIFFFQIVN